MSAMGQRKRARRRRKMVRKLSQGFADLAVMALAEFAGSVLAAATAAKASKADKNVERSGSA